MTKLNSIYNIKSTKFILPSFGVCINYKPIRIAYMVAMFVNGSERNKHS